MIKSAVCGMMLVGIVATPLPVHADSDSKPARTMSLTGTGEVKAAPDMAVVTVGVVREAITAREALSANNTAMASVSEIIRGAGVADKDMQTSGFSISPKYHYPKRDSSGERPAPKITGYTVSNNLSITVRNLGDLGGLLDKIVSAGSNQVNGIVFALSKPRPLEDEARKLAAGDARAKAQLYANATGVELGEIISISENARRIMPAHAMANVRAMAADAAESVPIARGEHTVSVNVNITWAIR